MTEQQRQELARDLRDSAQDFMERRREIAAQGHRDWAELEREAA